MTPSTVEDVYPLTPLQHGMVFHSLLSPDEGEYVGQSRYRLDGPLDVDALARAWSVVVARHGALRTSIVWDGLDEPVQVVHRNVEVPLAELDWSDAEDDAVAARWDELLDADRR